MNTLRKKKNGSVTPERFVKTFVLCNTYEDIAKKLKISVYSVKNKLYSLRKLGVKLDSKKKSSKINVDSLNDIIKKYKK